MPRPRLLGNDRAWAVLDAMIAAAGASKYHVYFAHVERKRRGVKDQDGRVDAARAVRIAAARLLVQCRVVTRSEMAEILRVSVDGLDRMRKRPCRGRDAISAQVRELTAVGAAALASFDRGDSEPFTPPQGECTRTENAHDETDPRGDRKHGPHGPILACGGGVRGH